MLQHALHPHEGAKHEHEPVVSFPFVAIDRGLLRWARYAIILGLQLRFGLSSRDSECSLLKDPAFVRRRNKMRYDVFLVFSSVHVRLTR